MLRIFLVVLLIVVLCLGASIGYFNAQPVQFNYLVGEIQIPLIAFAIGEFAIAVALTLLASFGRIFSLKNEVRRLRKQLRDADAELKNLRELPLKDA